MNTYVPHEMIYNDGNVNRSVSNASENKDEILAQKIKMEGKQYTADSGESD
jgi:hypothetical protein